MRFLWRSLKLFTVCGVPVKVHSSCLVYPVAFLAWTGWGISGLRGMAEVLGLLVLIMASLILHEFAHIGMARRFGSTAKQVLLIPFGCLAMMRSLPPPPYELWVALAGPATSFALAGGAWLLGALLGDTDSGFLFESHTLLPILGGFNLSVGCFNLVPCFPMDGGRILRSCLAMGIRRASRRDEYASLRIATMIAVRFVSWPTGIAIAAGSVVSLHFWPGVILAGLLLYGAELEYTSLRDCPDEMYSPRLARVEPRGLDLSRDSTRRGAPTLTHRFEAGASSGAAPGQRDLALPVNGPAIDPNPPPG